MITTVTTYTCDYCGTTAATKYPEDQTPEGWGLLYKVDDRKELCPACFGKVWFLVVGENPAAGPGVERRTAPSPAPEPVASPGAEPGPAPQAGALGNERTAGEDLTVRSSPAGEMATSGGLETAPAPSPPPRPTDEHHPSWENDRKWFFGQLRDRGIVDKYEVIAAFCEAHGMRRPSQWGTVYRTQFLGKLDRGTESRIRFDEWCGQHAEDVLRELAEKK